MISYPRDIQKRSFEAATESPGAWLLSAIQLRAAAQRLDWRTHPVEQTENAVSFIREYRMLIGLSIENLLKGLIVMVRLESSAHPPLPSDCLNHKLNLIAKRSELSEWNITEDEIQLLQDLSAYIEWAGRYPIPNNIQNYADASHSNLEHDAELSLYERLAASLAKRSWIMKGGPASMGGYKLKTASE